MPRGTVGSCATAAQALRLRHCPVCGDPGGGALPAPAARHAASSRNHRVRLRPVRPRCIQGPPAASLQSGFRRMITQTSATASPGGRVPRWSRLKACHTGAPGRVSKSVFTWNTFVFGRSLIHPAIRTGSLPSRQARRLRCWRGGALRGKELTHPSRREAGAALKVVLSQVVLYTYTKSACMHKTVVGGMGCKPVLGSASIECCRWCQLQLSSDHWL